MALVLLSAALAGGAVIAATASGSPAAAAPPGAGGAPAARPLQAFVTLLPQAYFVERIGGPYVDVHVLVGPGQSPHTFDPTPQQMARLAGARIFFAAGLPFERQLLAKAKAVNPNLQVIDTRQGIPLRWMTPAEAEEPGEGHAAHGHAGEPDPHFWLNPRYAGTMAATIEKALAAADPARAEALKKNLAAIQEDLRQLDARLREALAPLAGRGFLVYHPAFGYFADAYGLRQIPVEIEGKEPSARRLAQLVARAKAEGVRVIFVQPQFSAKSAEAVAQAIGGSVIPMDDLAKNYIENLTGMAEKIRRALAADKGAAQKK